MTYTVKLKVILSLMSGKHQITIVSYVHFYYILSYKHTIECYDEDIMATLNGDLM